MNNVNWNLIHDFLLVSQCGSLSAAAKKLGVSQPTLSRNIQSLESITKLNLFKRTTQGLQITDEGYALIEAAQQMEQSAEQFGRQVSGLSQKLEGDIRISANEIIGLYLLPPAISAFREKHPGTQIEIVITNQTSSLNKREADIALRMFRPTQPELTTKRLPDLALGFYAHKNYITKHGKPESLSEMKHHNIIGFDNNRYFIDGAAEMGYHFSRNDFCIRTDHMIAQINLARSGAGIVGIHTGLAKTMSELEPILEWMPLPKLEFWIVSHGDTQFNARIRALKVFLSDWFCEDPYKHIIL